jgi:hypothetical protein
MLLLLLAGSAGADCFRGRPLPECRSFWITESAALYQLDNRSAGKWHSKLYYLVNLGWMVNRNDGYAFGGLTSLGFNDLTNDWRLHLGVRLRRWVAGETAVDITAGIPVSASRTAFPSVFAELSAMQSDRIGATVRMEMVTSEYSSARNMGWYGGLRLGAEPGIVAAIAGPMLALIIALSSFDMGGGTAWYGG